MVDMVIKILKMAFTKKKKKNTHTHTHTHTHTDTHTNTKQTTQISFDYSSNPWLGTDGFSCNLFKESSHTEQWFQKERVARSEKAKL